jgi:hypothetical protein
MGQSIGIEITQEFFLENLNSTMKMDAQDIVSHRGKRLITPTQRHAVIYQEKCLRLPRG